MDLVSQQISNCLTSFHSRLLLSYRYAGYSCVQFWCVFFWFFGVFLQSCVVFYQLSAVLNFSLARTCPRRMWYLCKFLSLTWLWNATRTVLIMLIRCWRQLWKYSTNLIWNSKLMYLTFSLERQWILSNPLHGTTYSKIAKRRSLDVWNYCFWAKQWGIMINY